MVKTLKWLILLKLSVIVVVKIENKKKIPDETEIFCGLMNRKHNCFANVIFQMFELVSELST